MPAIETNTKSFMHLPHPLVSQFEEHLNRLKPSESASSSSAITHELDGLHDLHDCTDKWLQLSTIQQELAGECNVKSDDKLLESSLVLLDICSTAKDCLMQSKESIRELESILRRRRGAETAGFTIEGGKYLASGKKMKKAIKKAMVNLRGILRDSSTNKDNETLPMLSLLREAEAVTVSSLESSLLFICNPKGQLKQGRWSVISKLMQPKRVACDSEESNTNEFEKVDADLKSLIGLKHSSMKNFQTHLENLEMCIEDLEVGVESLSRQIIRARV